jgi:cyclopropane-fatty-acyl-phospholipid synthase
MDRYIFPDGELAGAGTIMSSIHDSGFEVRHSENLREHYAMTLHHWAENLESHWDDAVAEVGEATARIWGLYLAGCQVGFEMNWVQLHQILAVKLDGSDARFPLRPTW